MSQVPESLRRIAESGFRGVPSQLRRYHALSGEQIEIMLRAGFLKKEIREFDSSVATDFNSRFFQNMIRSRRRWVNALLINDWTPQEIKRKIQSWYRKKRKRSPWDFLDIESANLRQRPQLTQRDWSDFLTARREMSAHFGRAYGRVQVVQPQYVRGMRGLPRRRRP